jgi:plasmid maintenance system antidote protein VapI
MRGASQFTPEISEIIDRYIGTKPGFWHDLERAYESSHSSDLDDVTERYTQEHALGEAITRTVLSPSQVLRILQERAGMTQSELANALGITPSLLSRIMRDKVKITPEIAEEINKVFHVPVKFWDKAAENYKQSIREQWINRYSVDP